MLLEGLTILILFIVFSIIRTVVESEKKAAEKRRRQAAAKPRKVREEILPLEVDWEKVYAEAEKQHTKESQAKESRTVVTPSVRPSQLPVKLEQKPKPKKASVAFHQNDLVRGVIMAEILGPPRARKQFGR